MLITRSEVVSHSSMIGREILRSITPEIIADVKDAKEFEIKLIINGVEVEPKLLLDLYTRAEEYIDREAAALMKERIENLPFKLESLEEYLRDLVHDLKSKFKLHEED